MILFYSFSYKVFLLLTCFANYLLCTSCPSAQKLKPCECFYDSDGIVIKCGGNEFYDLKQIFSDISSDIRNNKLSDKNFRRFHLESFSIKELPESVFNEITFEEIFLDSATLETIHTKSFTGTESHVKKFESFSPLNNTKNHSVFEALSHMNNLEHVQIRDAKFKTIPSFALKGNLKKLQHLYILGSVEVIEENAFNNLNNLRDLSLGNSLINIAPKAFNMNQSSSDILELFFDFEKTEQNDGSLFENVDFSLAKRPIYFRFYRCYNALYYLSEKVFSPVLNQFIESTINLDDCLFNCTDCRLFWLIKDEIKHRKQILNSDYVCKDGKSLWDQTRDWNHCHYSEESYEQETNVAFNVKVASSYLYILSCILFIVLYK